MTQELKEFISRIDNDRGREDANVLLNLIEEESGLKAHLTGNIIGFGKYHYEYESGREGESFLVGFSPRKQNLAIYIMPGFTTYEGYLDKLGKYKLGKSCLYINKLVDIDLTVLRSLIKKSVIDMQAKYAVKSE